MFQPNPLGLTDGYKPGHKAMLAPGTSRLYGTWIPRSLKWAPAGITKITSYGHQLTWRFIHDMFHEYFFNPVEIEYEMYMDEEFGRPVRRIKSSRPGGKQAAIRFTKDMSMYLGMEYDGKHFEDLWDLGYLPIKVKALPEGIETDPNIPHQTFINTVDGFAWLTLYLETLVSNLAWKSTTAATIARQYRRVTTEWVLKTDPENAWLIDYMNHDFSARGLSGTFDNIAVALGHAVAGRGSDSLIAIEAARYYYNEPADEVCINSVNASEHSVTCTQLFYYQDLLKSGQLNNVIYDYYSFDAPCEGSIEEPDYLAIAEYCNLKDWLQRFPKGILSYVADTFNLWKLITYILPRLKADIMARDGKLVIRPDSGNPVDIICGTVQKYTDLSEHWDENDVIKPSDFEDLLLDEVREDTPHGEHGPTEWKSVYLIHGKLYAAEIHNISWNRFDKQYYFIEMYEEPKITLTEIEIKPSDKGVIELLWDIFGGDVSSTGYRRLDPHIGAIYGDSINLERQLLIYRGLANKGFANTNILLGIGSFTYEYLTRDVFGWAAKGGWFEILMNIVHPELGVVDVNKKSYNIYKDPITDDGSKTSLKGFVQVYQKHKMGDHSGIPSYDVLTECTPEEEDQGLLQVIYQDGKFYNETNQTEVREIIKSLDHDK